MKKTVEYLNEIIDFQFNGNISIGLKHLDLITNSLFKLTQSLYDYKEQPNYHLRELEGKYFRFGLANHSIIKLIEGNQFELIDKSVLIPDIFSFKSLTRMQIESYLIMHYLFYDNVSDEEKVLRYDIYKIHALNKQLSFKINFETPNVLEQRKKIESELQLAIDNMKASSFYMSANEKERKSFLRPRYPKLVDSKELFKSSGLEKSGLDNMWQLYSNYAHSEYISDRQYNTTYNIKKSFSEDSSMIILINLILTSKLTEKIASIFRSAKETFETLTEKERTIINTWSDVNK